ncbi:hypothetical protein RhiLY_10654 [Ceratobasidium sp. AG-Ba]|nr:hypothetical protein RhiLY_10654 [Ceratobasidium sp. AG-Ba]
MKSLRDLWFRSSKTRERIDLNGSSLAASGLLSNRLIGSSGSKGRESCFDMRFHEEWGNENCKVMQWYETQKVSSTRFQSIEHRRSIQGPFYHEYLLLKLTDGAICRVERMGEGSRTDAITYLGCTSYDLIQWIPEKNYGLATIESTLIAEINLGREFDILHVLAVCYTIHNIKPCSVYTLQRYNCYFLCLAILAVLTRRVANWETCLTDYTWDLCLKSVIDELSNLPLEEANSYVMLRLCNALDSDNPRATTCIFEVLRQCLTANHDCLAAYQLAISRALWVTSWEHPLAECLESVLVPATEILLENRSHCANYLREIDVMDGEFAVRTIVENTRLASLSVDASGKYFSWLLNHASNGYESLRRLKQLERPVPLRLRVLSLPVGVFRALFSPSAVLSVLEVGDRNDPLWRYDNLAISKIPFTTLSNFCSSFMLHNLANLHEEEGGFETVTYMGERESLIASTYISAVIDVVAADPHANRYDLQVVLGQVITKYDFVGLQSLLIAPGLARSLSIALESQQPRLILGVPREDTNKETIGATRTPLLTEFKTAAEFQTAYIKHRIDLHARRVERHQLADASLVSQDIQRTIQEVWKACRFKVW